ncbi:MAG: cation diffusion facilitator family transporter [Candidatus Methanoperedens sp.]|nr:cation diffusion facilitator family transporter [Candidatus Methanoperedens sp.]CAG0983790.1 Ferrous-iron efflux pump FieF [Methanosarcinales archaeon]
MSYATDSSQESDIRALKIVVGVYVLIFVMKLAVYFMTGVMAIFAEALHTLSDIFVSSFLLLALIYSRRQADVVHMFGYGRAQNVAALVAATLFISFTSFELYREAIPKLFAPEAVSYQNLNLALGVLIISMFIAGIPLINMFRQKKHGAAARAQLTELFNDELGLIAALIGTIFIIQGEYIADPIASIVVATIIAYNAIGLFKENLSFLLGRSPGPELLKNVENQALSVEGVIGVHEIRAEYIGPDTIHLGMHIDVLKGTPIEEAARIAEEVRMRVHESIKGGYCFIHMDAAAIL